MHNYSFSSSSSFIYYFQRRVLHYTNGFQYYTNFAIKLTFMLYNSDDSTNDDSQIGTIAGAAVGGAAFTIIIVIITIVTIRCTCSRTDSSTIESEQQSDGTVCMFCIF